MIPFKSKKCLLKCVGRFKMMGQWTAARQNHGRSGFGRRKARIREGNCMRSSTRPDPHREGLLLDTYRDELVDRITRFLPEDGRKAPLPGLYLVRLSSPTNLYHSVFEPAFCVVAQGCKEVWVGNRCFRYDPYHYLIATLGLPAASRVVEASSRRPYLTVRLDLDPVMISSILMETGYVAPKRGSSEVSAFDVSPLDFYLLEAVVRLLRLAETPAEAAVLAPLVTREIVFRLLQGKQGNRLRQLAVIDGQRHRVAHAIERIRREFNRPLRVERLAREVGMSVSAFYRSFRAVTGMSPLQFQKRLRLNEARRLMITQDRDAATAALEVGYESPSYFSREYKRLFGVPPVRDVQEFRRTWTGVGR